MADPLMTVEIDATDLLSALGRLGEDAQRLVKAAAKVTADIVANEARRRVRRRTGVTAAGINVREDFSRTGYIVAADRQYMPNVPLWLEFGTKQMQAFPFMFNAARLEESAHLRRVANAVQQAINAKGFGGG